MRKLQAGFVLVLAGAIVYGLHAFFKGMGVEFAAGGLFMAALYQFAHRIVHGTWIDF